MFSINYPSPWLIGSFVEYPSKRQLSRLQRLSDEVEFGPPRGAEVENFKLVRRLEYLPTGARFLLHIGFDAWYQQEDHGPSYMNYFVSMEPLNQAAKDFQKHPEVRELVPDTDPSWNGDALSGYSAPFHSWIQLANGMEDREYRAQPIIDFSERWNAPLRPADLRQMWHDLVDLSVYPNLELEEDLSHPNVAYQFLGLTHYFKVAAAHRGSTP